MSIAESFNPTSGMMGEPAPNFALPVSMNNRPLHRLAEVRQRQGISVRTMARRLGVSMEQVRVQERPDADLSLTELYRWQQALESPVAELLVDIDAPLSGPVLTRARLVRIMKTAKAILESARTPAIQRMASMLEEQLVEVMPELAEVSAWHTVGQRRTQDEMGRVAERTIPDSFVNDSQH